MKHGYGEKTTTGAVRFVHLSERQVGLPLTPEPYILYIYIYIYLYIILKTTLKAEIYKVRKSFSHLKAPWERWVHRSKMENPPPLAVAPIGSGLLASPVISSFFVHQKKGGHNWIVGFLRCSRGGGNWRTLRIPAGKIGEP